MAGFRRRPDFRAIRHFEPPPRILQAPAPKFHGAPHAEGGMGGEIVGSIVGAVIVGAAVADSQKRRRQKLNYKNVDQPKLITAQTAHSDPRHPVKTDRPDLSVTWTAKGIVQMPDGKFAPRDQFTVVIEGGIDKKMKAEMNFFAKDGKIIEGDEFTNEVQHRL